MQVTTNLSKNSSKLVFFLILFGTLFFFLGCSPSGVTLAKRKKVVIYCSEPRLTSSFDFHKKSREFLSSYYKTRKENELFFAWYASEDSVFMARSVKQCFDKRNKHFHAVQNILQKNRIIQKLITQNMRTDAQTQLSQLFLGEYRKIFVRDIQ